MKLGCNVIARNVSDGAIPNENRDCFAAFAMTNISESHAIVRHREQEAMAVEKRSREADRPCQAADAECSGNCTTQMEYLEQV